MAEYRRNRNTGNGSRQILPIVFDGIVMACLMMRTDVAFIGLDRHWHYAQFFENPSLCKPLSQSG
jgi:hypothetical protein